MNYKKTVPFATFVLVYLGHLLYFKIFVIHSNPGWWSSYLKMQLYFVSFSLALASSYGAFALSKVRQIGTKSKGATLGSAILALLIWFASCCGAPVLAALLGILGIGVGSVFLPPPVIALMTVLLVSFGYLWLRKQRVGVREAKLVCCSCGAEMRVPVVHCGTGVPGPEEGKLYCPCWKEGHTENVEIPKHCGKLMRYEG